MGRRRRRVVKVVKKKLPTVFTCPSCGEEAIRVLLPQGSGSANVQCGSCGLKREYKASPSSQIVDIYCKFTDEFYANTKSSITQATAENQAQSSPATPAPEPASSSPAETPTETQENPENPAPAAPE